MLQYWIKAARPRTLPLATAGIICGSMLTNEDFSWTIFLMMLLTASLLQILSNLANDYGDYTKGADFNRKGEARMVSSGMISPGAMYRAIIVVIGLSFICGTSMLALSPYSAEYFLEFLFIGMASILAAITYTMGKKAYGYSGFGDLAVFIFFGLISVAGSHFLMGGKSYPYILLPAAAVGMLCTGVLNLNNLRDMEEDRISGKNTFALRLGLNRAKSYQSLLILSAFFLEILHVIFTFKSLWQALFILSLPIFYSLHLNVKNSKEDASSLDPELKKLALSTLLFAVLIGLGNQLSIHA